MIADARLKRRYVVVLMILVAAVAGVVAISAISFLQRAAMDEQRARLVEQARSQARLIEAFVRNETDEGASLEAAGTIVIAQVGDALAQYVPAASTGEFQIGRRSGNEIAFLVRQRRGEGGPPSPAPWGGPLAVPMQRALSGQSGTMIGTDYRGVTVLAAYEPVAVLGYGVVAKVDLAEIRAPFRRAAWLALGPTCGAILLGGGLLLVLNRPLLRRAREAERRYEELVQTLGQGFSILDDEGCLTYVNDRLCEMLGYRRDELLGRPVKDLFAPESRDRLAQELARRRDGESSAYEVVMVGRDGKHRHVLISARPVLQPGGAYIGSFGVITDVTELRHAADELRREKELSQGYFDVAGVILVVLDSRGRIELINRRGADALGYRDASELIGRDWCEVCIPEEVRGSVRNTFREIMLGNMAPFAQYENQIVRQDGARRLILWHNTVLRDLDGQIRGTLSSGEDITELREQGERLAHLNSVLRAIRNVNQLITREKDRDRLLAEGCRELVATEGIRHAWIAQLDAKGRTVRATEAGIGDAFGALRGPLLEGFLPACCRKVLATGSPFVLMDPRDECAECPAKFAHSDTAAVAVPLQHEAKTFGVLVAAVPRAWATDREELSLLLEVSGDLAFALHDLDESDARRAAESALHESEEQYRSLFENAVLGIYLTSTDGRIIAANRALVAMLGFASFEELAARDLEAEGYEPDYSRAAFKERMERDGWIVGLESAWTRKDGSAVYVRENATAVRGADGRVVFYEGTVENITARRDAEVAKMQLEARLRQAQKLESIGTLASGIAHEINNPLTGMINYAQLISERTEKDALREFARGIVDEGNRVATIVRNLLAFSRQQKESHSPARIADIVAATFSLIGAALRKDGIQVVSEVSEELPAIRCRSQQIQQVLLNLLTNARDALNSRYEGFHADKTLRVAAGTVEHDGRAWIRLTVEDYGIGIPAEIIDRIFDPFFTTKPRDQGTGLGLSISYGIVRDHHGTLTVESEPGAATRFTMELPIDNGWNVTATARDGREM